MSAAIEEEERAGQRWLVENDVLPRTIVGCSPSTKDLAHWELVESAPLDDLFFRAKLAPGWRKEPAEHTPYWSYVYDAEGNRRARIFYKQTPYDRRASLYLECPEPDALRAES